MSLTVTKFSSKGAQYDTVVVKPAGFLKPPSEVTETHNAAKGKGVRKAAWDVIHHNNRELLALNKGHTYAIVLDGDAASIVDATSAHEVVDITGFTELSVEPVE